MTYSSPLDHLARMVHRTRTTYIARTARDPEGMTLVVPYAMKGMILVDPGLMRYASIDASSMVSDSMTILGVPVMWTTNGTESRVLVEVPGVPGDSR